jgi:hypothetical protein
MASVLEMLARWLEQYMPASEPVTRLVTGIIEQQSLPIHAIAVESPSAACHQTRLEGAAVARKRRCMLILLQPPVL